MSFGCYVLVNDTEVLDSKKAFVALSLFNILRFPLSMLPNVISNVVQVSLIGYLLCVVLVRTNWSYRLSFWMLLAIIFQLIFNLRFDARWHDRIDVFKILSQKKLVQSKKDDTVIESKMGGCIYSWVRILTLASHHFV